MRLEVNVLKLFRQQRQSMRNEIFPSVSIILSVRAIQQFRGHFPSHQQVFSFFRARLQIQQLQTPVRESTLYLQLKNNNSIQFNSLFQFTQSDTILYCLSDYLCHMLFNKINKYVFIQLFMIVFSVICMSCGNREGISVLPCSTL